MSLDVQQDLNDRTAGPTTAMTRFRPLALLLAALVLAAPAVAPAHAQNFLDKLMGKGKDAVPPSQLTGPQQATLQRVNTYFNSLSNVTANFEQTGPDGSRSVGKLYLARPGKIRFQYAPPSPLEIVSDGSSVSVKNRKLATQELWPLNQTPLRFLLASNIDLTKNGNVLGVYQEPELVSVVMEEKNSIGGKSQIQLMFSSKTYALTQWVVTDAQGMETSVQLTDVQQVAKLDDNLFKVVAQRWPQQRRP
ncbi:outer-membrane lipoprotein carrier protein LolA [Methylopila sp. M107]|uniref:outer-membrane lipoprotein carrier protein LolA n=1 Tax=Methylopila sp. M107 TaxID=1101190 RepID=UPI0003A15C92|nr:outer-membrane lipoprotein carrier protein LolA [Methylopila sp. M107]